MTIHLFNDKTGVISGYSPYSLTATKNGTLHIGSKSVRVTTDTLAKVPPLLSDNNATFVTDDGTVYDLGRVTIHNGGIVTTRNYTEREIELRHALDSAEDKIAELFARVDVLEHIFDTDSLNFLIPPEND